MGLPEKEKVKSTSQNIESSLESPHATAVISLHVTNGLFYRVKPRWRHLISNCVLSSNRISACVQIQSSVHLSYSLFT